MHALVASGSKFVRIYQVPHPTKPGFVGSFEAARSIEIENS
jgi:hypothetical protein